MRGGTLSTQTCRPVSFLPFPPRALSIVVSAAPTNQRLQLMGPQLVGRPPLSAGCDAGDQGHLEPVHIRKPRARLAALLMQPECQGASPHPPPPTQQICQEKTLAARAVPLCTATVPVCCTASNCRIPSALPLHSACLRGSFVPLRLRANAGSQGCC